MRIRILTLCLSLLVLLSIAEQPRVAVVDLATLTKETKAIQSLVDEMEQEITKKKEAVEKKMTNYQEMQQELERKKSLWSKDKREEHQKKMRLLQLEIEDLQRELNEILKQQNRERVDPILEKINNILEKVAKTEGWQVVVPKDVVLYCSPECDITQKVTDALNKELGSQTKDEEAEDN